MKTRVYISGINVVLSSDEIIELRKEYIGRNKHHRSFKIRGKIFTGLTDKEVENSDIKDMSEKRDDGYFPEMTKAILLENFSELDVNEMEKDLETKMYKHNRENIKKLIKWSNCREECYQKLIIENILEKESPTFLIIPSVFVKKMSISALTERGEGEFELLLYQKFNLNESIVEIQKGDNNTDNTEENAKKQKEEKDKEAEEKEEEVSVITDKEIEKRSANIGVISDNKEKYEIIMIFNISLGKLTVITPDETFEINATSGKGEYLNNPSLESQQAKNKGVLPVGEYLIKPFELSDPNLIKDIVRNAPMFGADWGDWRIRLHNKNGELYGRDNFFLHGGNFSGSAGCVDIGGGILGNKDTDKVKKIIKSSKKYILFKVIGEENND